MLDDFKKEWYILLPILGLLIFGLLAYPFLPESIPTHWNIHGEVDGWSGKTFGIIFLPLLNLALYFLLLLFQRIDPRRLNYENFAGVYKLIRILLHLFLGIIYLVSLLFAMGYPLRVDLIVRILVSLLIIIIGKYMSKIRHNYFVGIKTPWTLASEEVWFRTHRFSSPLWISAGFLGLILSFFKQPWSGYITFASYLIIAIVPFAYSYYIFRRLTP